MIGRGIELVVVSMGKDGACFVTADEAVVAHPPRSRCKSTVGAGDAMVAGILSGQLQKLSLGECARLATAFSIDSLSRLESGLSFTQCHRERDAKSHARSTQIIQMKKTIALLGSLTLTLHAAFAQTAVAPRVTHPSAARPGRRLRSPLRRTIPGCGESTASGA